MSALTPAERKRKQRALDREDPDRKHRKLDALYMFGCVEIAIILDVCGEVWFRGVDLAKALEIQDYKAAVSKNIDNEHTKSYADISTTNQKYKNIPGMQPTTTFVNEEGMNQFILRSRMPKAKEFSHWVCGVVLPSIRKTGQYVVERPEDNPYKELNDHLKTQLEEAKQQMQQMRNELGESKTELKETKTEFAEAKDEIKKLKTINETLTTRLFEIKPSCILPLINEMKDEYFVLYRKFALEDLNTAVAMEHEYQYYVCRIQLESLEERRQQLIEKYPKLVSLLQFKVPNSVNFFNYIKENLKDIIELDKNKNHLKLKRATKGISSPNFLALENEMLLIIKKLYDYSK